MVRWVALTEPGAERALSGSFSIENGSEGSEFTIREKCFKLIKLKSSNSIIDGESLI